MVIILKDTSQSRKIRTTLHLRIITLIYVISINFSRKPIFRLKLRSLYSQTSTCLYDQLQFHVPTLLPELWKHTGEKSFVLISLVSYNSLIKDKLLSGRRSAGIWNAVWKSVNGNACSCTAFEWKSGINDWNLKIDSATCYRLHCHVGRASQRAIFDHWRRRRPSGIWL